MIFCFTFQYNILFGLIGNGVFISLAREKKLAKFKQNREKKNTQTDRQTNNQTETLPLFKLLSTKRDTLLNIGL